jgi:hypothetical protein
MVWEAIVGFMGEALWFLCSVVKQWKVLVTGLAFTLLIGVVEHFLQRSITFGQYLGILAALVFWACFLAWREQFQESKRLGEIPPEITLTIHDVVMHRTGDQEWRWKNGEFLVQVSAELLNITTAEVEYSAQLVFRGDALPLTALGDVDEWEIIERRYYQQPYPNTPSMSRSRSSFVTNPSAITKHLTRSIRNEGWLHFQIEGMGETDIAKRTLRLYATAKSGGSYTDRELAQDHIVRSDLVAMRKLSLSGLLC